MDQSQESSPGRPLTRRELRALQEATEAAQRATLGGGDVRQAGRPGEAAEGAAPSGHVAGQAAGQAAFEAEAVEPAGGPGEGAEDAAAEDGADVGRPPTEEPDVTEEYDPRTGGPHAAEVTMELPLAALGLDEAEDRDATTAVLHEEATAAAATEPSEGAAPSEGAEPSEGVQLTEEAPRVDARPQEPPHHEEPSEEPPEDGVPSAAGATPPGTPDERTAWAPDAELPAELPPEPDVDDVRWEPAGAAAVGTGAPEQAADRTDGLQGGGPTTAVGGGWPGPALHAAAGAGTAFTPVAPGRPPAPQATSPAATGAAPTGPAQAGPAQTGPAPAGRPTGPARAGAPAPVAGPVGGAGGLPTLTDLLAARPAPPAGPAEHGWQGAVRRLTGGLVSPAPGRAEREHREAVATVQRSLVGPKTVVVLNPKGGAHKTTATLLIAATFGLHRGGYTLAWDNNETRGTLGWRSRQSRHHNTALNLLHDLDRFNHAGSARVGDLDNYVRSQGSAQFDVLASDEDAASAASIDDVAFRSLHRTLSRFYRVMVIDTGNNMRASNWQAAVAAADQVVIVSTVREDTAQSAAWAVDALRATGHEDVVRKAVTVLSAPAPRRDDALADRLHEHFGRLTRTVLDVPYDPALVAGRPLEYDALSRATREAWLRVTAAVAEGL